jgi:hypothetical protein
MKRIKLSEQEILAVIVNAQRELKIAFEMLPKKSDQRSKDGETIKKAIIEDLDRLLTKVYQLDIQENNLYDSVFKNLDKVKVS